MKRQQALALFMAATMTLSSTGISAMATEVVPVAETVTTEDETSAGVPAAGEESDSATASETAPSATDTANIASNGDTTNAENNTDTTSGSNSETTDTSDTTSSTADTASTGSESDTNTIDETTATEDGTETATETTTEPALTEETEETTKGLDETAIEIEALADEAPTEYAFPGMNGGYDLSASQIEAKESLAEHVLADIPDDLTEEMYNDADDAYVLGEVLYSTDSEEDAREVAAAYGGELDSYSYGVAVIELPEDVTVSEAIAAAADEDSTLPAVWPNYYVYADDFETEAYNDPYLEPTSSSYQWAHEYVGDQYAWAAGYTGKGIKVCVIDTGVRDTHEDLADNVIEGLTFVDGDTGSDYHADNVGHGTHVAGIIAAVGNNNKGGAGIAPDAQFGSYCVFTSRSGKSSDTIRAMEAAVEAGYDIINMSLGGPYYSDIEKEAVDKAYENGIAIIASAGNEATNGCNYPSAYEHAISVAAINESGAKAYFSNYGSTVNLAFPGVSIYSTLRDSDDAYGSKQGTSMAAPVASGTAAVILSADESIRNLTGSARVDALLAALQKGAIASTDSGMGAGTTYLPTTLGLSTEDEPEEPEVQTAPEAPTITIDGTLDAAGLNYTDPVVTVTLSASGQENLEIYYSISGRKIAYKDGKVRNGTLLEDLSARDDTCSGEIELSGKRKVTLYAITINTETGLVSDIVSETLSLRPIVSTVTVTQANNVNSIAAGSRLNLKATVFPTYAVSTKVHWSVDEAATAAGIRISTSGVITTRSTTAAGTYTATATAIGSDGKTYDGASDNYEFTVINQVKVRSIKLSPNKVSLSLPDNTGYDLADAVQIVTNPAGQTPPDVVWSSSKPSVATVDQTTGHVTAVGKGKATIYATINDGSGKKAACVVTVTSKVTGITISGPTKVAAGKSITLKAAVTPADASNRKVTWSVLDNSLVTIGKTNGRLRVQKKATGTCTVRATAADSDGTVTQDYTVTIISGAITRITLVQEDGTSASKITLKKMGNAAGGYVVGSLIAKVSGTGADETAVEFCSSNTKVLDVVQNGERATLKAKASGTATVTCRATDGSGKSATSVVTIVVPMSKIWVTSTSGYNRTVAVGKSVQLAYRYGTSYGQPTSTAVQWSSSDTSIATVTQSGKVTVSATAEPGQYTWIWAKATDGSGVYGYKYLEVGRLMQGLQLSVDETDQISIKAYDADGTYNVDYYDTKVSGADEGAGCETGKNTSTGVYYATPVPKEITYPYSGSTIPDDIDSQYMQEMTVTVTLKDGSNVSEKITVNVARNKSSVIRIFPIE